MNRELLDAINIQSKREGFFWPVLRAIIFEQLAQRFPAKSLLSILSDHRGGSWGSDQQAGLLPAPSLRSPDIRHGKIDYSQAETRYYTPKELEKHRLQSGDILVIKSNGSLDLVGKSQLFVSTDPKSPVTASNFVLVVSPDRKQVDPAYLDWFLKSPQALVWRVDKQRTTTGLRNLDSDGYLATSVPVPPNLEIQIEITEILSAIEEGEWPENPYFDIALAERAKKVADAFKDLASESEHQQTLLAKLKQAILQEAIQGKLTADWRTANPDVEPASQLLQRIQAEKARLIAEKKLRPEKPLPKITPAEIPFEIPKGWEWCPLAAVMILRDGERIPISKSERERRGKVYPYYGASGVIDEIDGFTHDGAYLLLGEDGSNLRLRSTPIAFGASGKIWVNNHAHVLEFIEPILQEFIAHRINGMDIAPFVTGGFQPKLSQENLNRIPIPLPPLAEQAAIVERVESLMTTCLALEAEIEQSRTHAANLLQAVLKEAFAPTSMD